MNELLLPARKIYSSQLTSGSEIRELLEALFVAELLVPSDSLWLVSPWLTDLDILDNRGGAFAALVPAWGLRRIRLSEVLIALIDSTRINVVARPDEHNTTFLSKLADLAQAAGAAANLRVVRRDALHLKGLLAQDYYLSGSMNLTYSGIELNEEEVSLERSPQVVATARIHFAEAYGGRP